MNSIFSYERRYQILFLTIYLDLLYPESTYVFAKKAPSKKCDRTDTITSKCSRPKVFCKKGVLKNLCWRLFLLKLQANFIRKKHQRICFSVDLFKNRFYSANIFQPVKLFRVLMERICCQTHTYCNK